MNHNSRMEKKKEKSVPILAHISPEHKKLFYALAKRRGMSASRLLGKLVEATVQKAEEPTLRISPSAAAATSEDQRKTEYLSTRISLAEWQALNTHIRRRGITVSIFLRLLIQAYMTGGAAFDPVEVAALREANLAVAKVGRLLNQGVKELATNPYADPERELPEKMLRELAEEVGAVRKRVESLLRANTRSWAVIAEKQKGGGR